MSTSETRSWAPDFYPRKRYPSAGKHIGPAWEYAWSWLDDGSVWSRKELAELMVRASGSIKTKTAENLLAQATEKGLLLIHSRGVRHTPYLVRADLYYAQHPEEAPEGYQPPRPPEEGS